MSDETKTITIEDQLEHYKAKCKALGQELWDTKRELERVKTKSVARKRNIRGMQRQLELIYLKYDLSSHKTPKER